MRKVFIALGLLVALAIPVAAYAANLDETKFQTLLAGNATCKSLGYDDGAFYYFVNNQTLQNEKAPNGGTLTAIIDGNPVGGYPAIIFNQYNQHFEVFVAAGSTLTDASTNLAGKLVLSHVTCKGKGGPVLE